MTEQTLEQQATEVMARFGGEMAEETETDPDIRELGEAMLAPMAGMTGDQVADAESELGMIAQGAAFMAKQLAPQVARGLATCDEPMAWEWIARLVAALARVRHWPPAETARQLYLAMGGDDGLDAAPPLDLIEEEDAPPAVDAEP